MTTTTIVRRVLLAVLIATMILCARYEMTGPLRMNFWWIP